MNSAPSPGYSLKISSPDNKSYTLQLAIKSEKLDISISNNSSIALSYNAYFTLDELYKLNRLQLKFHNGKFNYLFNLYIFKF